MRPENLFVLAFGFASPWLLGGLALGAVPVVIHLLHKRRYREVPWAAMRFLLAATKKHARRLRLEQLVLLVVRAAILVLLVLALARPRVESLGSYFRADAPTHRIVIVDTTYSMRRQSGESNRLDRAQELARQIVRQAPQGDAFNLVRVSMRPPHAIVREPAFQRSQILDEIDRLRPSDEPADLPAALQAAVELLAAAPELPRKEVYFISDFQAVDWTEPRQAQLVKLVSDLTEKASLTLLDVGQGDAANAAVVDLFAKESFITTGTDIPVQAVVRNFGRAPLASQVVEFHVDGQLTATREVDLPPGEEVPVEFRATFSVAGEHRLEVRIPEDGLPLDNRRWLAIPVRDEVRLLLVDGRQSGRASDRATYYLERVLAPSTATQSWQGVMRPRVIADGQLASTDLSLYDCVVLANVPLLTEREADFLSAYVAGGGGLVVCLGDQVRAENFNEVLYRDGKGPLPARLEERRGSAADPKEVFQFDPGELRHPIVSQYRGNDNAGLENTLTLEYVRVSLPADGRGEVALRYGTGDPAIVDAPFGRGRVILFTTSTDNRWGPWPLQTSFPPIVHETVRHAVSGRWTERQRRVGEPLARNYAAEAFQTSVTIHRPDGTEQLLPMTSSQGSVGFTYADTDRAGIYEVEIGAPLNRTELFAVNVDPAEGNLEAVGERALRDEILKGIEFRHGAQWRGEDRLPGLTAAESGQLARWLLWAVAGLVLVEQVMAWRFAYGCLLLYALVAAAMAGQLWAASGAAALTIAILAVAGLAAILLLYRGRTMDMAI